MIFIASPLSFIKVLGVNGEWDIDTYSPIIRHQGMHLGEPQSTPLQVILIRHGVIMLVIFDANIVRRGCYHQVDRRQPIEICFQYIVVYEFDHLPHYTASHPIVNLKDFFAFSLSGVYLLLETRSLL